MDAQSQAQTEKFLRTCLTCFTVKDMCRFFASIGIRASAEESIDYLESSPWVFALTNGSYITRAGAFTGAVFSIKPSASEYGMGMMVPGSRCLPFVDGEVSPGGLTFVVDGKKLPQKVGTFDCDQAIDLFILYGEEYAPQYIASDAANAGLDIPGREFDLPNKVRLTGVDISLLIEEYGMRKGDRLLCCVEDWDRGVLSLSVVHDGENTFDRGADGSARLLWYQTLETVLKESFDRMGPCSTIEEQLGNVFFEYRDDLCVPRCGSVEEYLNRYAKDVGLERFGVETRLWHRGQSVPAVGNWNNQDLDLIDEMVQRAGGGQRLFSVPGEACNQYIRDMFFRRSEDYDALLAQIYPGDYSFHKNERACALEELRRHGAAIAKGYNWFADQEVGQLRGETLELFTPVSALVYKVDCMSDAVQELPQQELVILTQIYNHLFRILQSLENDDGTLGDVASVSMSLDGMRWNYEDIHDVLEDAVAAQTRTQFKVLR